MPTLWKALTSEVTTLRESWDNAALMMAAFSRSIRPTPPTCADSVMSALGRCRRRMDAARSSMSGRTGAKLAVMTIAFKPFFAMSRPTLSNSSSSNGAYSSPV